VPTEALAGVSLPADPSSAIRQSTPNVKQASSEDKVPVAGLQSDDPPQPQIKAVAKSTNGSIITKSSEAEGGKVPAADADATHTDMNSTSSQNDDTVVSEHTDSGYLSQGIDDQDGGRDVQKSPDIMKETQSADEKVSEGNSSPKASQATKSGSGQRRNQPKSRQLEREGQSDPRDDAKTETAPSPKRKAVNVEMNIYEGRVTRAMKKKRESMEGIKEE
jgi:hypothetical protein